MVVGEGVVPDLGDAVADLVEEEAVVGDEDDREGVPREVLLQPVARLDVQVVGRFVEQEHVRLHEEEPGQGDPHLPPPGELAAVPLPVGREKAEAAQHVPHLRLHGVAPLEAEFLLEMSEPLQERSMVGSIVRHGLQASGQFGDFPLDPLELFEGGHCLGEQGPAAAHDPVLGEVTDSRPPGEDQVAGGMFHLAGDDPHEGGLARPVFADEADPFSLFQVPVYAGEEGFPREVFGELFQVEHRSPFMRLFSE